MVKVQTNPPFPRPKNSILNKMDNAHVVQLIDQLSEIIRPSKMQHLKIILHTLSLHLNKNEEPRGNRILLAQVFRTISLEDRLQKPL